jgi:DNA mismatch repair ATPase MutS
VPARSATLCLFDQVWHNRGNAEGENLSSFGREVVSLAEALNRKGRTLYLFDELAKGTNPQEGEALLTAVLAHLAEKPCLTLAATHYDLPSGLNKVQRFAIKGIDPKELKKLAKADKPSLEAGLDYLNSLMDYNPVKIDDKQAPPQNAIPIAALLGLPQSIIRLAEKLLKKP